MTAHLKPIPRHHEHFRPHRPYDMRRPPPGNLPGSPKKPHRQQAFLRGLTDRFFPLTFFIHNLIMLRREPAWKNLPLRLLKAHLQKMLRERAAIFLEAKEWLAKRQGGDFTLERYSEDAAIASDELEYCTHCGGCCEIASGLPDFPPGSEIPARWKRLFGDGLGKGHRFCPFMWEVRGSGASLCAIHPWRSRPCRTFEQDECEFFRQDPDFIEITSPANLVKAHRWLIRLLNG